MAESISEKRIINQNNNIQNQNYNPQIQQGGIPQQMGIQTIPYGNQPQYGQPVMIQPMQGGAIVVNQATPTVIISRPLNLGTSPVSTTCPFCRNFVATVVEQSFNCGTCCLCWCTGFCFFALFQLCRGKDICCYDAVHKCPRCGKIIGTYDSC